MESLTEIQQDTLVFIKAFIGKNGYPPTIKEMSKVLGVAGNAIQGRVDHLEHKGYITRTCRLARSIRITEEGQAELDEL